MTVLSEADLISVLTKWSCTESINSQHQHLSEQKKVSVVNKEADNQLVRYIERSIVTCSPCAFRIYCIPKFTYVCACRRSSLETSQFTHARLRDHCYLNIFWENCFARPTQSCSGHIEREHSSDIALPQVVLHFLGFHFQLYFSQSLFLFLDSCRFRTSWDRRACRAKRSPQRGPFSK